MLLATFYGRVPSTTEAQNLARWAAAYGPGGTFWQGKSYPANMARRRSSSATRRATATSSPTTRWATYAARAQSYAQRAKDAAVAIRAANRNVGLLAIGDNAVNQSAWMTNMLKAVPNLADLVAGWTIHPYGPSWATRIDSTVNSAKAAGARDLPIWVTEWGLSTDNGRCLSDNYGFDKCMTLHEAASTLHSALAGHAEPLRQPPRRVLPLPGARPVRERHENGPRGVLRRAAEQRRGEGRLHDRDQGRPGRELTAHDNSRVGAVLRGS